MKAFQVALLFILSICIAFLSVGNVSAQSTVKTYNNPLAYVGVDGNYYVTGLDGTGATAVTSNMAPISADTQYYPPEYGSAPHCSPWGEQFAFVDTHSALDVVETNKQVEVRLDNAS